MAKGTFLRGWFRKKSEVEEETYDDEYASSEEASVPSPALNLAPERPADGLPSFLASAIDRPTTRTARNKLLNARLILRDLFTPAQPVTQRNRFAGRLELFSKLIEVLEEQRSHVVLYGERGIGKTSTLHILSHVARESQYIVAYVSCGGDSRFDEIFRSVLREIPLLYLSGVSPLSDEAEGGLTFADKLPASFNARELSDLLSRVIGTRVIIILDEYDRIEDPQFRRSVAELIKNLSDRAARVQLVLAGVSSNLQELIGYIPSIRRNIVGLPMPRMTGTEVRSLINLGEKGAGIRFEEPVTEMISLLSNGSPYLVRLLSHHACMKALDAGRMLVQVEDIRMALEKAVQEARTRVTPSGIKQVNALLDGSGNGLLAAIAKSASTPDGWFTPALVAENLPTSVSPDSVERDLQRLSSSHNLLERDDEGSQSRFRFRDEALPTYLWLRVASDQFQRGPEARIVPEMARGVENLG